ncbi:MAG: glycosyltransferase, partial [Aeromicrobium sp.]
EVNVEKYCRTKVVGDAVIQVDHLREDGSVVFTEHRVRGVPRRYVHYSSAGVPTGTLASEDDLLAGWIDTLPRDPVAWMIVDSRVSARLLLDYKRPDVVVMHVLHHSHLTVGMSKKPRKVTGDSKPVLERMDDLDAIVFLTDSQLRSVEELYGDGSANRFAIPNVGLLPVDADTSALTKRRDRRRGIMLARYDEGKRVDYAIRAIASAADSLDPRTRPTLDVYGGGPRIGLLQDEIEAVSVWERTVLRRFLSRYLGSRLGRRLARSIENRTSAPRTRLHGHTPDAREMFWDSSFSLLTSKDEACPLVVIESMARGAIPICFDIDFGPRDMITDGVNGVLIPFRNRRQAEKALATAIRRTVSMSHRDLTAMRLAGHRRAQDFDGTSVTQRWIEVMATIQERRFSAPLNTSTTLISEATRAVAT